VNSNLAVSDIRRNFREGMPVPAHCRASSEGHDGNSECSILHRFEEILLGARCESVDGGIVINDESNERLVQGQASFSVAALGGMGQNLE